MQAYAQATPDRAPTVKPAVNSFQLQNTTEQQDTQQQHKHHQK